MGSLGFVVRAVTMSAGQNQEEVLTNASPRDEREALRWASLLCGMEIGAGSGLYSAGRQVLAWAALHPIFASETFSEALPDLPEACSTLRFREETEGLDCTLEALRRICNDLRADRAGFIQAMAQVSQEFLQDPSRLAQWKDRMAGRAQLVGWLPAFERSFAYLRRSFVTPVAAVEEIRDDLFAAASEPHRFLDSVARQDFDDAFLAFKQGYAAYYCSAHEDAVHIIGNQGKMESRLDFVALRNLEMLSGLEFADGRFLNRVREIGKWMQSRQCDLPVLEILERQPRCYCNFNPEVSGRLAGSVEQMNEAIRQGIDHFRSILRRCKMLIIQELKNLGTDDQHSRQIAALLAHGPMVPLKQQSVDILNAILQKHAGAFRAQASGLKQKQPQ